MCYLVVWLFGWNYWSSSNQPNQPTKKLKNHKTKQQTWICSRLFVSLSLCSKILSLDKSKSKTSFYLELFSLIRIFVGSMVINNVYSRKK